MAGWLWGSSCVYSVRSVRSLVASQSRSPRRRTAGNVEYRTQRARVSRYTRTPPYVVLTIAPRCSRCNPLNAGGRDFQASAVIQSSPTGKVRSFATSILTCQSVRSCNSKTARPNSTDFCTHVAHGCGSILLWRRGDTLCTSGFVDDVVFT